MWLTIGLTLIDCALLFLLIWWVSETLPSKALLRYLPDDVKESMQERVDNMPMTPKRIFGIIGTVVILGLMIGTYVIAAKDGEARGFTFSGYLIRFLTMSAGIKIFDIVVLDYWLLTKTDFFIKRFPETADCEGWQDFGYNRKQQISHIVMMIIACIVFAWLAARFL